MSQSGEPPAAEHRALVLSRLIAAPRAKVYRAWTEPELLTQWFAPQPWTTSHAELDVRPGGASLIAMRGPDGNEFANRGVFLDVVANRRLVFTDAYITAWEPSPKPFMTVVLTFADEADGTRCPALDRRGSRGPREQRFPRRLGPLH